MRTALAPLALCLVPLCITAMSVGPAAAYVYPGRPNCPWYNLDHTWAKYLARGYGDKEPFFSVRFKRHIGDIEAGQCYTVTSYGKGRWSAFGKIRNQNESKNEHRTGGNPAKSQFNLWGAKFRFNEGGEVYLKKELVGHMYCHIGNECWK
ncbi:hypothetical protein GOL96_29770 [Sinorhizobium medicae]|nr:hypothetical protein [Sinorhizobium medicae]MDX1237928.1 hypothetical protein [Sinorhizobium medicae]